MAIRLSQALAYYAETAHDWERQALIKVRHSAGDTVLAREFIRAVQPHVYTEGVNFAAIKTALVAREKMHKRRQHGGASHPPGESVDVKLDRFVLITGRYEILVIARVSAGGQLEVLTSDLGPDG